MKSLLRLTPLLVLASPQALAQSSPSLGATQNATLQDTNSDGAANRGERINYEVDITNSGGGAANGVNLTETIDPNTTLVPGSMMVGPVGIDDAYNVTGNVAIQVPANAGVLANDIDPDGGTTPALTAIALDTTGTQGMVSLQTDGSFTYSPPAGFNGSDSFKYTVRDASGIDSVQPSLVTLSVSEAVWFVDSTDSTADDATAGTLANPFNSIAAFNAANTGAPQHPGDNHAIHLASGIYTNGTTLRAGQKLIGQGVTLNTASLGFALATHSAVPTTGSRPEIQTTSSHGIQLAVGNIVRGLNIGSTPANTSAISGNAFGTLILSDLSVAGSGGILNLANGALRATNTGPLVSTSSSGVPALLLDAINTSESPAFGAITITGAGAGGISITNTPAVGVPLLSLGPVSVTTTNGTGLAARSAGSVTLIGSTNSINSALGGALDLDQVTLNGTWSFTSIVSTNSTTSGVSLSQTTGNLTSGTTRVTDSTASSVNLTAAAGIHQFGTLDISGATQTGLFATNSGTISATGGAIITGTGTAIDIDNTMLGLTLRSVSVNGAVNGINLADTTGSLTILGDGAPASNGTGGLIQNTTSDGIILTNATDITLNQISMSGTTRNAIRGRGTSNLTIRNSSFTSIGTTSAIPSGEVHALDFNSGDGASLAGITGNLILDNVTVNDFIDTGLFILNETGTLNATIQGNSEFNNNDDSVGRFAINVEANANAAVSLTVDGARFDNIESSVLRFEHDSNQASSFNFDNNLSLNGGGPDNFPNGGGVEALASGSGNLTLNIRGNTLTDLRGDAINLTGVISTAQQVSATIGGPAPDDVNILSGGSISLGDGIQITKESGGIWDVQIENNQIGTDTSFPGLGDDGIQIINRDNNGNLILGITGNTIEGTVSEAIRFFSDEDTGIGPGNPKNRITIQANNLDNISDAQWIELRTSDTANACYLVKDNMFNSSGAINIDIAGSSAASISQASLADLATDNPGSSTSGDTPDFNSSSCNQPIP